ncbi:hypothetical protein WJX72_000500 [[Myrmecia] bisecta]|uniref:NYN domain-containing protein n=1 Tax=[Myrmecia] bisecta TaxID=41462 RepID=A0AAW1Q347_9CHLO
MALAKPQLAFAVFDTRKADQSLQQASRREELSPEYLRRRKHRRETSSRPGTKSTAPANRNGLQAEATRAGMLPVTANAGLEADDIIGALCASVTQRSDQLGASAGTGRLRVLVVSGDADMQQVLRPHIAWMQPQRLVSPSLPAGFQLLMAADFDAAHGFPPESYPFFLALTGKKEASIGGVGIGASSAQRLPCAGNFTAWCTMAATQGLWSGVVV